ncbi:MAG: hypothetical protein M1829_000396 [Trizodia sp. TS-e1964]|nr:MAG: hypothetical protein M1829_000396 [Trizodia sp. TS-e1964]
MANHQLATPPRLFYEKDASLAPLSGRTIVFAGYGNQGRAQALNLHDSINKSLAPGFIHPTILVANPTDEFGSRASADGFEGTADWAAAAARADVLFLLVPDQVQPRLFNTHFAPSLKSGCTIVVASGYNVFYKKLDVARSMDLVLLAPRMIGASVRSRFEESMGFPCFISVEQDSSGNAWRMLLALALGIGALQAQNAAIECSAREETLLDLFTEQAVWPSIIATFREAYSTLRRLGCSDEALVHEMWLSREPAEVFGKAADEGFFKQLKLHSSVSQYGQLTGSKEFEVRGLRESFRKVAEERILGGEFAKEFEALNGEREGVEKKIEELFREAELCELGVGEKRVRKRLGLES